MPPKEKRVDPDTEILGNMESDGNDVLPKLDQDRREKIILTPVTDSDLEAVTGKKPLTWRQTLGLDPND